MEREVDDKIIERLKKLLALAQNNDNEHQAAAAMEKLQELLEAYNLDMLALGSSGKGAQRTDKQRKGGLYSWQRRLWENVAKLNFCYYMSIRGLKKGSVYEHRVIGSHANVIATEMMAAYLQDTVERLAQQWAKDNYYKSVFVRDAIAYREGMADRISERLQIRRDEQVRKARAEEEERKRNAARDNVDPGTTALTIVDVISTEADFNSDYLNGWEMGTTARKRHEQELRNKAWRAEYDRKRAAMTDAEKEAERIANEKWWAEHAKKEAARAKRRKKDVEPRYRRATPEEERRSLGSYYEGRSKGEAVNLDQQVGKADIRKIR